MRPGECRGNYSDKENCCTKICSWAELCKKETANAKRKAKKNDSVSMKRSREIAIPSKTKRLYDKCVFIVEKEVPFSKRIAHARNVIFKCSVNGKTTNMLVVLLTLDKDTSVWKVVVKTAKGWRKKYRKVIESDRDVDTEYLRDVCEVKS